jgi:hypothetical protein
MRVTSPRHRSGPLRIVVECEQGSDGLTYEWLDCKHRLLLMAGRYGSFASARRRCPRCSPRPRQTRKGVAACEY